jgi:hypothetical protein
LATLIGRGLISEESTDDPSFQSFDDIAVSEDGLTATAKVCTWSTGVLKTRSGAIVNADKVTYHDMVALELIDGRWWLSSILTDRRIADANECGPKP